MDKIAENKEFHEWWKIDGPKYGTRTEEGAYWALEVRYWSWKAWEARAAKEELGWNESIWGDIPDDTSNSE